MVSAFLHHKHHATPQERLSYETGITGSQVAHFMINYRSRNWGQAKVIRADVGGRPHKPAAVKLHPMFAGNMPAAPGAEAGAGHAAGGGPAAGPSVLQTHRGSQVITVVDDGLSEDDAFVSPALQGAACQPILSSKEMRLGGHKAEILDTGKRRASAAAFLADCPLNSPLRKLTLARHPPHRTCTCSHLHKRC